MLTAPPGTLVSEIVMAAVREKVRGLFRHAQQAAAAG